MKMSNFSLTFLLTMVFPIVLLAVSPAELPKSLFSTELEGSGTYSEDDYDDFYSGSGSGGGFVPKERSSTVEYTENYHIVPSTPSSSPHSSSQVTVTEISSQDITKNLLAVPVHSDLPVVNTTTDAIVTSPMSSTTISKDFDDIVPEPRANNFLNTKYNTTVAATQMSIASPKVPTTLPDHAATVINDESFTVSSVIAANEITTMEVTKANLTEEDGEVVDSANEQNDLFISEEVESRIVQKQNLIHDHQSSAQPPNENYSHDYSTSGSFLERRELLAAAVAGGFVGLLIAVMLVVVLVYRMKKKDEGSYTLDDSKQPNGGYQKPQKQEEFYA